MLNASQKSESAVFSMIEMMVAITIFSLTLMLGISGFRTWIQNTQIRTAAEAMQNGLQRARAEAVRRNMNVAFVLGNNTDWRLATDIPVTTANTIDTRLSSEGSQRVTSTVTPAGATAVSYNNYGLLVGNSDASASITQIDLRSSIAPATNYRSLRILVGNTGSVRMCDPALTAGTIGAC